MAWRDRKEIEVSVVDKEALEREEHLDHMVCTKTILYNTVSSFLSAV